MTRILAVLCVLLALAALFLGWRGAVADARAAKAEADFSLAADAVGYLQRSLKFEREQAGQMADIGTDHEEDRQDADAVPAAVVADLNADRLRLRKQWAACETHRVSESAAAAAERDALAELRRKDQGDLVRVGRDANDQVRACQAVVRAYETAGITGLIRGDGVNP